MSNAKPNHPYSTPKRPWFQFSLWTLLVVVTVLCVMFAFPEAALVTAAFLVGVMALLVSVIVVLIVFIVVVQFPVFKIIEKLSKRSSDDQPDDAPGEPGR